MGGGRTGKMNKGRSRFVRGATVCILLGALSCTTAPARNATATLGPSSGLRFGYVMVGATSSAKTATLTNNGPESISVGAPSATGQFDVSATTCTGSLSSGSTCSISIVVKPTSNGAKTGALNVTTNATTGALLSIPLSAKGAVPGAKLSATSLAFGDWAVGATSTPKTVKLTNTGKANLKITRISANGDFKQSNDCGSSLRAGKACRISVTFKAGTVGTRIGKLTVKDDATSGTQSASLSGMGVKLSVALDRTILNFRIQRIHTTSFARSATLTNNGSATLFVSDISTSKPYSETNTCGSSVPAGGSCTISVTFAPEAEDVFNGTVTITGSEGVERLALTGIGGFPAFSANLKTLSFGNVAIGSSGQPRAVKVTNGGTDKLFIDRISVGGDFGQTNTCEPYVNPGITCTISLTFTPTVTSALRGVLVIRHELGVYKVSLRGVGLLAGATPSSTVSSAGNNPLGPAESSGGRGLTGGLKLMALLGLALLLGGGVYLWRTRTGGGGRLPGKTPLTGGETPDGAAGDVLSGVMEGDEAALEWFLVGPDEPEGEEALQPVRSPSAGGVHELDRRSQPKAVRRSQAAGDSPPSGNGERGEEKRPFDWQTEPGSDLA
jgi:Abnormal spindle-like microcephaly-assoc'd, ASPM-SPD-2-Hydin